MRVELGATAIPDGNRGDLLRLLALWWMAHEGRHRVLLPAGERSAWEAWIQARDPLLREALEGALAASEAADAYGPALSPTVVVGAPIPWTGERVGLDLVDAVELLARPLRVLVEDGVHDRAFLLAFASPAVRELLEHGERKGWLRFEHGGGKDKVVAALKEDLRSQSGGLRVFCVVDSDRRTATAPDPLAATLRAFAAAHAVEADDIGRVLWQREAENYAPIDALIAWLLRDPNSRARFEVWTRGSNSEQMELFREWGPRDSRFRRACLLASLRELPPAQRAVFDMKEGAAQTTFAAPPSLEALLYLDKGLGDKTVSTFYEEQHSLLDPTGEITQILSSILRRR